MKAWALTALVAALALAACGGGTDAACERPGGARCDGDTLVTCADGDTTERDCGAEGLQCGYVDVATNFTCVPDACALVGPLGRCVGDYLTRCTDGVATETQCADGQVCGYLDDTMGYGCKAAAETMMVSGEIRYEDRPQTGRGPLGELQVQPVRGAQIVVIDDATMQVLATVVTADNGSYVARFTATAGTMVHVSAAARSTFAGRPLQVTNNTTTVHAFGSPSFPAAAATTLDLTITEASGVAEAFNVLDQGVTSMDVLTRALGVATPVPLRLRWSKGSQDGTYFDGSSIHLLGAASDDDGYDDTVIHHEIGHYVERTVGRSDSPGGGHNGSPTDPRLAWSEGYATYWAQSTLGQPVYSDSNAGGGFADNIDTSLTRATGSGLAQQVSENMVSQILWDLGDTAATDDDLQTTTTHHQVNTVQRAYLKSATLRSVGTAGVDLVDFLDGWFVGQDLASCAAVKDIVTTKRSFPYDYAGPAGACP